MSTSCYRNLASSLRYGDLVIEALCYCVRNQIVRTPRDLS